MNQANDSCLAQEERQYAIKSFKSGAKDVMVASGVASKGLDFNDIQHVIIFSMPKEIEDYVHQIGRTGRSGKTGIATTFVNMNTPEQTLLDLKYLLMEAGQKYAFFTPSRMSFPILMLPLGFPRSCRVSMIHELLKEAPSKGVLSAEVRLAVATLTIRNFTNWLYQVSGTVYKIVRSWKIRKEGRWRPTEVQTIGAAVTKQRISYWFSQEYTRNPSLCIQCIMSGLYCSSVLFSILFDHLRLDKLIT